MSNELFRKRALDKYLRVDAPGAILTIAPPLTLVVAGVMALAFFALLGIGIFGRAQMTAVGRGVVRPDLPPVVIRAPFSGTILSVVAAPRGAGKAGDVLLTFDAKNESAASVRCTSDLVAKQQEMAALEKRLEEWNAAGGKDPTGALVMLAQLQSQRDKTTADERRCEQVQSVVAKSVISFPIDATVEDIAVAAGAQVSEGDILATLSNAQAKLVGYLALGERYRAEVKPGMTVRVKLDALPYDEAGAGRAHVVRLIDTLPTGVKIDPAPPSGRLRGDRDRRAARRDAGPLRNDVHRRRSHEANRRLEPDVRNALAAPCLMGGTGEQFDAFACRCA